eukprot:EC097065.1.p1 GENE.EC097065.1~~EC097065.1.p1  ORF type:complete len:189 (-),score=15.87 EC097065.1:150-716(-)
MKKIIISFITKSRKQSIVNLTYYYRQHKNITFINNQSSQNRTTNPKPILNLILKNAQLIIKNTKYGKNNSNTQKNPQQNEKLSKLEDQQNLNLQQNANLTSTHDIIIYMYNQIPIFQICHATKNLQQYVQTLICTHTQFLNLPESIIEFLSLCSKLNTVYRDSWCISTDSQEFFKTQKESFLGTFPFY